MVAPARAKLTEDVAEQRQQRRLSIAEMNEMDGDELYRRLARQRFDNRGPVTKFLDLIDAPRNFIAGRVFGNQIRQQKEQEGETGAFGEGKVFFSDILKSLGVRTGLAASAIGFVGDVALDPLTYLGPAGWGGKLAAGGRSVEIGAQGLRAARGAVKALEAGEQVRSPELQRLAQAFASNAGSDTERAAILRRKMFGQQVPTTGQKIASFAGVEPDIEGSAVVRNALRDVPALAEDASPLAQKINEARRSRIEASKGFVNRYARGAPLETDAAGNLVTSGVRLTPKGIAIGDGQAALAHIPFTEYGVYGPSFTSTSRSMLGTRALALATQGSAAAASGVLSAAQHAQQIAKDAQTIKSYSAQIGDLRSIAADAAGPEDKLFAEQHLNDLDTERSTLLDDMRGRDLAMQKTIQETPTDKMTVGDLLYLDRHRRAASGLLRSAEAEVKSEPLHRFFIDRLQADPQRYGFGSPAEVREAWLDSETTVARGLAEADPRAQALRDTITDKGLYEEALQPLIDEHLDALHERRGASIIDGLLDMNDNDLEELSTRAEALHDKYRAAEKYAQAVDGQIRVLTGSKDRALAEASRKILGVNAEALDSSLFSGPRSALAEHAAHATDPDSLVMRMSDALEGSGRLGREWFGNRGSDIDNLRRSVEWAARGGDLSDAQTLLGPIHEELSNVARNKYGFKTARELERFNTLVMLKMYEQRLGSAQDRFFMHEIRDGQLAGPSRLAREITDARAAGWFDPAFDSGRYAELHKDAEAIAARYNEASDKMLAASLDSGTLASAHPAYVPMVLAPEAEAALAPRAAPGPAQAVGGVPAEGAQRSRQWTHYPWRAPDGTYHELYDADFALADRYRTEAARNELAANPRMLEQVNRIRADVDLFRQQFPNLTEEERRAYLGHNVDPWRMDELNRSGRFDALWLERPERMFTTNAMHAMLQRTAAHVSAQSRKNFGEIYDRMALQLADRVETQAGKGADPDEFRFSNGVVGRKIPARPDQPVRVLIGDRVYRQPDIDVGKLKENALLGDSLDARRATGYLPEQAAEALERIFRAGSPETTNAVLKVSDKLIKLWKGFTLGLNPAWIVGNVLGSVGLMAQGGIDLASVTRNMRPAMLMKLAESAPEKFAGRTVTLNGREFPIADLRSEFERTAGGTGRSQVMLDYRDRDLFPRYAPNLAPPEEQGLAGIRSGFARRYQARLREQEVQGAGSVPERILAAMRAFGDEGYVRKVWEQWAKANAHVEDSIRGAAWLSLIDKGLSAEEAGNRVREVLLDFGDLTKTERSIRTHVFPFYSWVRNNAGYQFQSALRDPKWIGMYTKLKEAVEEAVAGDEQVPEHMRPNWMRDQLAIQIGSDPGSRYALTVGNWIPTEPVNVLGGAIAGGMEGAMKAIGWLGQGIAPTWAVPLQFGFGREFFSGREIGPEAGTGDLSATEFLANQIRPVRELVPTGPRTPPLIHAAEAGAGPLAARLLAGGRAQPFDDERIRFQKVREFKNQEQSIRKYIAVAAREGDEEASLRGRVRLLALYRGAEQAGLDDIVPRWARQQLSAAPSPD